MRFQRKDTEQVHVTLGGYGLPRMDERRFVARVLDAIFGGLSSSRLFQAVREERGLAYSVFSFTGAYEDAGQVGLYVGTRPDNLAEAMEVVAGELATLREAPATAAELERAKENVKARIVLGMESSASRMNRLGGSILYGVPLLEPDDLVARIDAVRLEDLEALAAEVWAPERLSAAGIGPDEDAFRRALQPLGPRGVIRVAVAGAAGRMGHAVCAAVEAAEGLELAGRADPALDVAVADVLGDADVLVDFTQPGEAVANAAAACAAGVHVVVGTTGFALEDLRAAVAGARGKCFWAPNFAIGAVLMMRFAAEASKHMAAAEIVEYHHPAKLDAPSGTAARTAELMRGDVPIHSVRLPGIVADQEGHPRRRRADPAHRPRDDRPHELHARRDPRRAQGRGDRRVPARRPRAPAVTSTRPVVSVAVTDHAVERFRQRVAGGLDTREQVLGRVAAAWAAGRVQEGEKGTVRVADERRPDVVYVCRWDRPRGELVVITLWEEGDAAAVPRGFTDELRRLDRRAERARRPPRT